MRADLRGARAVERFEREARAGGRLAHPGVVGVYSAGVVDGVHYIAQELVEDGFTLADYLRERRETAEVPQTYYTRVAGLFVKIADALQAAHDAGIVHRDIKPPNILITRDDEPRVGDFGLARVVDELSESEHSRIVGTYYYMSPEQASARSIAIDHRSDEFSLGAVLYEALTLKRPFEGDTGEQILDRIRHEDPIDPREVRSLIPVELAVICGKMLQKRRADRYPSMAAFAADLRRFLAHEPISARPPSRLELLQKWTRRHPTFSSVTGLSAAGLLVVSFLLLQVLQKNARLELYADERLVPYLEQEVLGVDPPTPARAAVYESWLELGRAAADRLPQRRRALASLGAASMARAGSSPAAGDAALESDLTQASLEQLVTGLEELSRPGTGLLAWIEARMEFARGVEQATVLGAQAAAAWERAMVSIADEAQCPAYGGLEIRPQLGLLPLGRDPASGLWEFAHLLSGELPQRDEAGRMIMGPDTCIVLVLLPGGEFVMGSQRDDKKGPNYFKEAKPNEKPHTVSLDPFFVGKHEITQGQWLRAERVNPAYYAAGQEYAGVAVDLRHPMGFVSWYDSRDMLARLDLQLPTEAQWEFAARAGTRTPWYTGNDRAALEWTANIADDSVTPVHGEVEDLHPQEDWDDGHPIHAPAGTFEPNPFGLYDIYGNVWEWCLEYGYRGLADTHGVVRTGDGLRHTESNSDRILRGGSFSSAADSGARSGLRNCAPAAALDHNLGLRATRPLRD